MEFIWDRNIFLMSLFNGREIMEGSNIFIKNSISPWRSTGVSLILDLAGLKQMDIVGESGPKQVYFPLKNKNKPCCSLGVCFLNPILARRGTTPSRFFLPVATTSTNWSAPNIPFLIFYVLSNILAAIFRKNLRSGVPVRFVKHDTVPLPIGQ